MRKVESDRFCMEIGPRKRASPISPRLYLSGTGETSIWNRPTSTAPASAHGACSNCCRTAVCHSPRTSSVWRWSAARRSRQRWRRPDATLWTTAGAGSITTMSKSTSSASTSVAPSRSSAALLDPVRSGGTSAPPSPNTRRLVVDEGGFLYDSDAYNDELPYWNHEFGRPHLIIPHTLDDNDTRLARGLGWGQAGDFFTSLKDNFDALYTLGSETPRMMTVAVHCRLAGKPARAAAFARFVDYVLAQDRVWVCRRLDIARHWAANHPPMEQAST